ncbi:MAG: DUF1501 domain-containing protein [Planctomycetota bacterium]|nr:DUF1501 domain-containing protein [Planctomycetota bacterium]
MNPSHFHFSRRSLIRSMVGGSMLLPAYHQGTRVIPGEQPIEHLVARTQQRQIQELELGLTAALNRGHLQLRQDDSALAARMKSFETAFQMQTAGPEAFDVATEDERTHAMYGLRGNADRVGD